MEASEKPKINNIFAPDQPPPPPPKLAQTQQQSESIDADLKQQYSKYEDLNKDHEGLINKLSWVKPSPTVYENLVLFLKKRIEKGHGETILALGVAGNI